MFFLGGGALVSCSTSTPINHIVFFLQNTSCIRKPQVIQGGVSTPCTLPLIVVIKQSRPNIRMERHRVRILLSSSNSMTFHELFPRPFHVFHDLMFSCHFHKMFKTFRLVLGYLWTLSSSTDTNSGVYQCKMHAVCAV